MTPAQAAISILIMLTVLVTSGEINRWLDHSRRWQLFKIHWIFWRVKREMAKAPNRGRHRKLPVF